MDQIVAKACLVNKTHERLSELFTSNPTNREGAWNQNCYFDISNPNVAGVLLQFFNLRNGLYFGNLFICKTTCVYRRIDSTFPIHPCPSYRFLMHGVVQMELKLTVHGEDILPRQPQRIPYDLPYLKQNRERTKDHRPTTGHANISYIYYPPTTHHEGAVVFTVYSCSNLDADINGKSDPYVCVEIVENGLRHCFVLMDHLGNKYKPKKYPDQSPLQRLGNLTRTKTMKETLNPVYSETFIFIIRPHQPQNPFFIDINVWDYDRLKSDNFVGNYQLFEPDMKLGELVKEEQLPLYGIFTEHDVPKKYSSPFEYEQYD